jgi:chromosome segregation ATPase
MHAEHLVLEHLNAIRSEIAEVKLDTTEIRQRLSCIDASIIELRRSDVHLHEDNARQQLAFHKLVERVQRIERRLELM